MKVIQLAKMVWAAPIVFAPENDCSLWFYADSWKLNAVTELDYYPISRMDKCIDSLGDALISFTLVANRSNCKLDIGDGDHVKNAFTTHQGLYRFFGWRFRLGNPPWAFQQTMEINMSPVKWQFVSLYLCIWKTSVSSQDPWQTHWECSYCIVTAARRRRHVELENFKVLYRGSGVLGTYGTPRLVVARFSSHSPNWRLKTTTNSDWTEGIFLFKQCIPTFCSQICSKCCTA